MKPCRSIPLLLMLAWASSLPGALPFRTDINPALRYYQAFLEAPDLPEPDHRHLFVLEWRGQLLDRRFEELIARYDYQFRFLREAAHAKVACDWGIDLTQGPDALLPGLARAKAAAQTTRLRTLWHLHNGRQAEARDDLLAAFTLARNVSRDGVLISALVQMAMENILVSVVAENLFQWQPDILRQIVDGFDAAPSRGTVAQCIPAEKLSFHDWLLRGALEAQRANPGNEAMQLEQLKAMLARISGDETAGRAGNLGDRLIEAGGGTMNGVLRQIRELEPLYERMAVLASLPHGSFEEQMIPFMKEVASHPNPLVHAFFPVLEKCRVKEFAIQIKLAMLRAGAGYKLDGELGLNRVNDPAGTGPFALRRFVFMGKDRGFELRSAYAGLGHDHVLIFVETNGAPFMIDGKNAGKPVPPPSSETD